MTSSLGCRGLAPTVARPATGCRDAAASHRAAFKTILQAQTFNFPLLTTWKRSSKASLKAERPPLWAVGGTSAASRYETRYIQDYREKV